MRRKMNGLAIRLANGARSALQPPLRGKLAGIIVLACVGYVGAIAVSKIVVVNASAAMSVAHADTTTATTSTTNTTTTTPQGGPPPYDQAPNLSCPSVVKPNTVHRSKIRHFQLVFGCYGLAEHAKMQLTGLGKGTRFIGRGSREQTCMYNNSGPIKCWQKHPYHMEGGYPTWDETHLTQKKNGHYVGWTVWVNVALKRSAPIGKWYFHMMATAQDGQIQLPDSPLDVGGSWYIHK